MGGTRWLAMLLTTRFYSQVHSRGHKPGDGLERRNVALARHCCVAGAVMGVSLASCPLMSAAAVCEGGGGGFIFLCKEPEAQRSRATSRRICARSGPHPQPLRAAAPCVPQPLLLLCLLAVSLLLLHSGSTSRGRYPLAPS